MEQRVMEINIAIDNEKVVDLKPMMDGRNWIVIDCGAKLYFAARRTWLFRHAGSRLCGIRIDTKFGYGWQEWAHNVRKNGDGAMFIDVSIDYKHAEWQILKIEGRTGQELAEHAKKIDRETAMKEITIYLP